MTRLATLLPRVTAALPDAVTSCLFVVLWIAPLAFGERGVGHGVLVVLVEFVMIHAAVLLPLAIGLLAARVRGRAGSVLAAAGCIAAYLFFVAALSFAFDSWWPCLAFTWMIASKFLVGMPAPNAQRGTGDRYAATWALSGGAYVLLAIATVLLPIPELGFATVGSADFDLPHGATGIWIRDPQRPIAFGAIHFATLAWIKWRMLAPARAASVPAARG